MVCLGVLQMKIYFKVIMREADKETYIGTDTIAHIANDVSGNLSVELKDGKRYFVKTMDYIPESRADMQDVIKIGSDEDKITVPVELVESVKEQHGAISIGMIKNYVSSGAFNSLCRNGFLDIGSVIYAIEENRLIGKSGMGKATMQEIIGLFLQMDLIERKDDQAYKPFEGYTSKMELIYIDNEEGD